MVMYIRWPMAVENYFFDLFSYVILYNSLSLSYMVLHTYRHAHSVHVSKRNKVPSGVKKDIAYTRKGVMNRI